MKTVVSELVLYGHPDSGHACKVAAALSIAGLPFRSVWVDIWAEPSSRPPELLGNSPFAEVPMLLIGKQALTQSGAILVEIARRYLCLGGETPAGLRRGQEVIMWEANRIGMCLPQLKEAQRVQGRGFGEAVIVWLKRRYDADVRNFDRLLGDASFLHGDAPGIGDCSVWGYTQWLDDAAVEPSLAMRAWLERMRALPGMKSPAEFFPAAT